MKDQIEQETAKKTRREQPAPPVDPAELRQQLLISIGKKLTAARLATGEPLEDPARKLKLRRKHLEALENGNWAILPEGVYAMGFLRQYSTYLGIDLSDDIERLKSSTYALTRPLTFPDPPVAPSRRWAWLSAGGFLVLMLAFNMVYQGFSTSDNSSDVSRDDNAPIHQDEYQDSDHTTATADREESTPARDDSATGDTTPAVADAVPVSTPAEPVATPAAAPTTARAAIPDAIQPVVVKEQIDMAAASPDRVADQPHTYRFEAVDGAVWMQISLPDAVNRGKGKLIKEVLLHKGGEVRITQPVSALWLTCGNAPSLRIWVDGRLLAETGSLGDGKKVLRDHRIEIPN
ncbi:XRE family transcriptional regulator [Mariprofundus erugo]|uniref:helix-turn-helix domain-containing protein n=1 Tax=Mariprofundus erugo TaxID=2528639 RepID=UPI0010FE38AB|nr:helix-turn-helix domain-containing protein [Mariprofundus erugo]TLS74792.1 XRE family transcriptional regulator [Mariprofundus erugo]